MEQFLVVTLGVANFTNGTVVPANSPGSGLEAGKVVLVLFLGSLTLLTVLLNGGVMAAICTTKKLHIPANYLICSLAATDFLVAVLVMPLSIMYVVMGKWPLGQAICEAWLSLDMTCCTCSILHLCAIALDRYCAITNAVRYAYKRTARRAYVMVGAVWAISTLISIPPLFWRYGGNSSSDHCIIKHDHIGYTLYSTVGAFYAPLAIILALYFRIFRVVKALCQNRRCAWRPNSSRMSLNQNSLGHCPNSELSTSDPTADLSRADGTPEAATQLETGRDRAGERARIYLSRERKAARTLGLILGAFVLCWLPFFLKELLVGLGLVNDSELLCNTLTWLGYVNSLINPLLYTSFNEDFKHAFRRMLRCEGRV
ncbi:hypothetical protein JZ751_002501 [Albula glossodonta]|uniref:G-protein coupled receptors family 1 profile domain-containing protein n=1 Tax=Albula glossodonta TaxID=121402 RepID=A0A8T2N890_9TELE|nr:hypothetical protein JZ751_002501 [Albula glossodonta]